MQEVDRILDRCRDCGLPVHYAVWFVEHGEDGEARSGVRGERVPHSRAECQSTQALMKETWPRLW